MYVTMNAGKNLGPYQRRYTYWAERTWPLVAGCKRYCQEYNAQIAACILYQLDTERSVKICTASIPKNESKSYIAICIINTVNKNFQITPMNVNQYQSFLTRRTAK